MFEVVADDITDIIGKGIALPKGTYPGVIEWRTVMLAGHSHPYLAMAKLFLSGPQGVALGVQNARDVWCSVEGHVKSGKIKIVEASGD